MTIALRRLPVVACAALLAGTAAIGARTHAASGATLVPPGCATTRPGGGDWPSYGGDLADSRFQAGEDTIGTANAGTLAPAWVLPVSAAGAAGQVNSTPTVADGCLFVGTSAGDVLAVNADTGKPVWRVNLPVTTAGNGGTIVGATVVSAGRVFALVDEQADGSGSGPYAVALDEATGRTLWKSAPMETYTGSYTNASPAVLPLTRRLGATSSVLFAGWSPPEGDSLGQGGFVLIDTATGRTITKTYTIPPADQAQGYAGGGIWSAPAYDPATGFAYIGASNPYSKTKEHKYTNALLKIDLNPGATFGQIVGSYKGNVDQYNDTLQTASELPACEASDSVAIWACDDPVCGQLDLDFGAAPNLFRDRSGRLLIGGLQKAGVFHAADAATMAPAWHTIVGGPCLLCNAAGTAAGPDGVYGVATPGGVAFGLDDTTGSSQWTTPVGGVVHYESTSTANGVVYTFDTEGFLDGFDAVSGATLLRRPMAADAGEPLLSLNSAGIAIARHTVFVAATAEAGSGNAYVIAYRPA